jgi:hypothetical protein
MVSFFLESRWSQQDPTGAYPPGNKGGAVRNPTSSFLFVLGVLLLQVRDASAHHPSAGFGPGISGPILTIPAVPMEKNRWSAAIRTDYQKFDRFSNSELESLAASGTEAHSMDDQTSIFFSAGYGLTEDLAMGMHIPYVIRRGIREGHIEDGTSEVHNHGTSEGIGDLSLVGQYQLFRKEKAGADVSVLFGLKTPTGDTKSTDRDGVRFETEFQPGSGSWDPLIGTAVGWRLGQASLEASLLYAIATKGSQETDLGDSLHFGVSLAFRHTPAHGHSHGSSEIHSHAIGPSPAPVHAEHHSRISFDFVLEATGEWRQKQTVSGISDPNSGGTIILLSPGVRVNIYNRYSAFFSAGIPVLQDLNGTQHETRHRLVVGISAGL